MGNTSTTPALTKQFMEATSKPKKKRKMRITSKTKMNPKQLAFAEYILQGFPQTQAYIKAGYFATGSNIRSASSRLAARVNITSYIDKERQRMVDGLVMDRFAIQQRLYEIGMGMYHDEVVTSALCDEDERGHKSFKPVVVQKRVGAKESIIALSYLDKTIADREMASPKQDEPDDPLTSSIKSALGGER
jgi:phage terminase small subunit